MSTGIRADMRDLTNVQFLSPLNLIPRWNEFSDEWKKVRRGFSEPSVHDFRVATRRLISELEFATAITHDRAADTSIRKFKTTLRRFGTLRDVQVHLLRAESEDAERLLQFSRFLRRREKEEVRALREWMREKKKKVLRRCVWNANRKLQAALTDISRPALRAAMEGALQARFDAVTTADASFRSSCSAKDFHHMRINFKRFRYAAEIAKPVLGVFSKRQMDHMRELQKIMGEIHDLQTYMAAVLEWSGTRVPVGLQKECNALMKAFNDKPVKFEEFTFHNSPKAQSAIS
jgi:CHAD domain-containing protein